MQRSTSDLESLGARVEKLERQNRAFKRAALGLLLLPASLLAMGQARQARPGNVPAAPGHLVATDFTLVDEQGRKRADLGMFADVPMFHIYGENGTTSVIVGPTGLSVWNAAGNPTLMLYAMPDRSELDLFGADSKTSVDLSVADSEPSILVTDADGFETDIGTSHTVTTTTGETHQTSAASIMLFGKDRKVLWSTP